MEVVFIVSFILLLSVLIAIEQWKRHSDGGSKGVNTGNASASLPHGFTQFRNGYVLVYSLMMGMCIIYDIHTERAECIL